MPGAIHRRNFLLSGKQTTSSVEGSALYKTWNTGQMLFMSHSKPDGSDTFTTSVVVGNIAPLPGNF